MFPTLVDYLGLAHDASAAASRAELPRACSKATRGADPATSSSTTNTDPCGWCARADWKYVHRYPDGPHELFDLRADPGERVNLVDDPAHAAQVARAARSARGLVRTYVDPRRDGVDKGVTGCGQLRRVEDARPGEVAFADRHLTGADWDLWLEKQNG